MAPEKECVEMHTAMTEVEKPQALMFRRLANLHPSTLSELAHEIAGQDTSGQLVLNVFANFKLSFPVSAERSSRLRYSAEWTL